MNHPKGRRPLAWSIYSVFAILILPSLAWAEAPEPGESGLPLLTDMEPEAIQRLQQETAARLNRPVVFVNPAGMSFTLVPAVTTMRGNPEQVIPESGLMLDRGKPLSGYTQDELEASDAPWRRVTVTRPFYIGTHEVTHGQWQAVTETFRSTYFPGEDRPVNMVRYHDVVRFARMLSRQASLKGSAAYRAPTEAEWELACRAGSNTAFPGGDGREHLAEVGWYVDNSGGEVRAVGQKKPNALGIHDMHGNVWEWCSDLYHPAYYVFGPSVDPTGPERHRYGYRVVRGGSALHDVPAARAWNRAYYQGSRTERWMGFRLVLPVEGVPTK